MRALAGSCLVAALVVVAAAPARAHITPTPSFVRADGTAVVTFAGPNERRARWTSFELRVPAGLRVAVAFERPGWQASFTERTASWTGGGVRPFAEEEFSVELVADGEARPAVLVATQRYPDGKHVSWPVVLTVVPADEPSQRLGRALAAGVLGLLALTIGGGLLWRRRLSSLQER